MLPLANEARGRLLALRRGPGYEDLVDILAKLCEESERNLLQLDRSLAERRVYPAIDVEVSSTRHDDLLFAEPQLGQVAVLRRLLGELNDQKGPAAGLGMLLEQLAATKSNDEFLAEVAKTASGS